MTLDELIEKLTEIREEWLRHEGRVPEVARVYLVIQDETDELFTLDHIRFDRASNVVELISEP